MLRTVALDDAREVDVVLSDLATDIFGLGTGWDFPLIALDAYLRGEMPDDPSSFMESPGIPGIIDECGRGWAVAAAAAGAHRAMSHASR